MKRNEINIPFHCLDILKRRVTKLKVSGGIGWNSFHPIHSIIIFQIHPTQLHSNIFNQSKHRSKVTKK
jgi:hypothetical protein